MKKVIRLNESDLVRIVKKVIEEQVKPMTLMNADSNFRESKNKRYMVNSVKGKPVIVKNNKELLLTKGMIINPNDHLKFNQKDEIFMRSLESEDIKNRWKQTVQLNLSETNPNKLEIFVHTN